MTQEAARYKNVFVIDDSPMDTLLMKIILKSINYAENLTFFNEPLPALEHFKEIDPSEKDKYPDIIFLDINMPEINGFEFLEKFNHLPKEIVEHTEFFVVSSSEDLQDLEKSRNFKSVKKYLVKPINKDLLLEQ
jgi:response regulator RpfG family c-di-GMP phosphodiesterase